MESPIVFEKCKYYELCICTKFCVLNPIDIIIK